MTWSTVTDAPPRPFRGWPVLAWILGAGPVLAQYHRLGYPGHSVVLAAGASAIAVLLAHARWQAAPLVLAALLPVLHADSMTTTGAVVLLTASCTAWTFATPARAQHGAGLGAVARSLALPPLIGAVGLLLSTAGVRAPLALIAVAAAGAAVGTVPVGSRLLARPVAALGRPLTRVGRANLSLLDRIGEPVGRVLGAVAMVPAAVAIAVSWCLHRLTRHDPLAAPTFAGTNWVDRVGDDPDPSRAFSGATFAEGEPPRTPFRRAAVTVPLLALAVLAASTVFHDRATTVVRALRGQPSPTVVQTNPGPVTVPPQRPCHGFEEPTPSPALVGQPGWPELECLNADFIHRPTFDAATVFSYADYRSRYLNERDGVRRGWHPPPCTCRRVTVWWFGGSAAWGALQRDGHTIASDLARRAHRDGIELDVTNFAMPAWVLGQEARRFMELTVDREPPDVVIFYDGGNELHQQLGRARRGRGADPTETAAVEDEIGALLLAGPGGAAGRTAAAAAGTEDVPPRTVARVAMERYARDRKLAQRIAASVGARSVFVWQPLLVTSPPAAAEPDRLGADEHRFYDRMLPVVHADMPAGVIDLSDVFQGQHRPLFHDMWHTNERGASIVAAALFARIRPELQAVAGGR